VTPILTSTLDPSVRVYLVKKASGRLPWNAAPGTSRLANQRSSAVSEPTIQRG
jgi:hypothetical protein